MPFANPWRLSAVMIVILGLAGFAGQQAQAVDGLVIKTSDFGVTKTIDRLGIALERKGITVFKRVNHAKGAAKVGLDLAAAEVILFGNPKLGTPLMQSNPMIGLDPPLKALAWKDADGTVKLCLYRRGLAGQALWHNRQGQGVQGHGRGVEQIHGHGDQARRPAQAIV
jgi:uncharacterized protein (DUF302 family)